MMNSYFWIHILNIKIIGPRKGHLFPLLLVTLLPRQPWALMKAFSTSEGFTLLVRLESPLERGWESSGFCWKLQKTWAHTCCWMFGLGAMKLINPLLTIFSTCSCLLSPSASLHQLPETTTFCASPPLQLAEECGSVMGVIHAANSWDAAPQWVKILVLFGPQVSGNHQGSKISAECAPELPENSVLCSAIDGCLGQLPPSCTQPWTTSHVRGAGLWDNQQGSVTCIKK